MKRANVIVTACFTALIGAFVLINAHAQDFTGLEKSILTFSRPVEFPGLTLQPGTYVFQRPDANSARIIQVFTDGKKEILGTFLTIPAKRLEVTSENVVTFRESREGMTPAVQYWYYPGRETGHEFLYSKEQAMRIAARIQPGQTVQSTEGAIAANPAPVETSASVDLNASAPVNDSNEGLSAQAEQSSATSARAETEPQAEAQVAANQEPAAPAYRSRDNNMRETVGTSGQANANNAATDRLPSTASPLALYGLIGLLSLAGAASLRRVRA